MSVDKYRTILDGVRYYFIIGSTGCAISHEIYDELCRKGVVFYKHTGFKDKNGIDIYFNDKVKIKRTLHDGQYTSEAIYSVNQGNLCGIELRFVSLVENGDELNQYPVETTLCERYGSLDVDFRNQKYDRLAVPDTWGENHILRERWRSSDYSNDIEVINV